MEMSDGPRWQIIAMSSDGNRGVLCSGLASREQAESLASSLLRITGFVELTAEPEPVSDPRPPASCHITEPAEQRFDGEHKKIEYLPTLEEIQALVRTIQSEWSEGERAARQRSDHRPKKWTPPGTEGPLQIGS